MATISTAQSPKVFFTGIVPHNTDQEEGVKASYPGDEHQNAISEPRKDIGLATPRRLKIYSWAFSSTCFGIGSVFASACTYMTYQVQNTAYATVGWNPGKPRGTGCLSLTEPCRVPLGSGDVNLTSLFLYMNAICYAVSGVLVLLICGWGDHLPFKREQYIFFTVIYGTLALPAAGLTAYTFGNYTALLGLYTSFNIVGFLAGAWMNIFVPYTMQEAESVQSLSDRAKKLLVDHTGDTDEEIQAFRQKREGEGMKISVWGNNALSFGTVVFYLIVIGLCYASADLAVSAGLYMTTAAGGLCIGIALVAWRALPNPIARLHEGEVSFWLLPSRTFAELWRGLAKYPEAFKVLLAYTIYNDSVFAFSTVITNLYNLSVRPGLVEYTCYSLISPAVSIICSTIFLYIFRHTPIKLRQWMIIGYTLVALTTFWCLLGLSDHVPIGFKHRAEFYVFQAIQGIANGILVPLFRVLFCEMFPQGSEIQYFGFQQVLSLCTVWIPQVVDSPIVNATNNQRIPAITSFVFFLVSIWLVWWTNEEKGVQVIREREVQAEAL